MTLSVSCAILRDDGATRRALRDLIGRPVILKTQGQRMAVGLLTALPMTVTTFYETLTLSVEQMDVEEGIDLD